MEPMSVRIGQILVQKHIINQTIFQKALAVQKQEPAGKQRRLQQILVEDFRVDRHQVYSAIAQLYAFKQIDLTTEKLSDSHLDFIRKTLDACTEEARSRLLNKRVLPYRASASNKNVLTVIAADPLDREIPVLLKDLPYTQIEIAYCQFEQVGSLIDRVMAFKNEFLQQLEASLQNVEVISSEEEEKIDEAALDAEINRSMLTNLIEGTLVEAVRKGASDIHIIPKEGNVTEFHFRVDGKLQLWHALSTARPESIAAVIKDRSINIDRFNRNIAQDGYIQRKIDNYHIRFRVSVLPIVVSESNRRYESIVIRVLDDRKVITDLNLLGLQEQAARDFEAAIRKPQGVIIITGPTGSGKSTTLVAALNRIMDPTKNVVTVEEPVEYLIRGARQVKLGPKLNFDQALRSILRHDPDIVMVGEMRDLKSAEIAVSLANTGHITFSTLHTNDAPSAISRLYMLGVEPFLIANAINFIMAQRLVRKLCENCKQPAKTIDLDMARYVGFTDQEIRQTVFYQPVGCDKCYAGYRGRQCITEALLFTQEIRHIILKNASNIDEDLIRQEAIRNGMLTLRASGRERIKAGTTTIEEVVAATVE
ncbi:MAG: type II/IV secretion system protein [candidate division KSB1 bacterium]|nr:type II/IV secretion system protein [candidate division KSB1 bacterium]MDZ7365466.1 type II/IV secretion system protein [candidate division KSB1 bacterium]MDZ7403487.1 type II/IV secretion system protein [candidate division KSB1 bacterium]